MTSVQSSISESSTFARRSTFISHFTPSLMTPEVLETIFTGRQKLLEKLVEYGRSSVLTSAKQFTLLVAPRGFGKTHLVALTYYRLKAQEDLRDKMLLAWLREEEWGITSFLDFLLRVFRALEEEYPDIIPAGEMDSLYELSPAEAEAKAADLLRQVAGDRTVILLLENMDDIFAGLGDNGQKRLRAYLQENPFISILATSTGLFNGVSRRTSPFFGFFRVVHLEPMSFEEAVALLEKLARLRGDDELADFIVTPLGRARVRAIHHLSGGNYRVYVIFSQFLARETLDELVGPFMNMLDELTPYYQSRMQLLSPQQRKIIEYLVDYRAAAPVKLIAQRGFMTSQSASSQLSDLQDKGYVRSEKKGRESFYELREPLMRLCMEVKKERGEPIGLFVNFLRIWHSKDEIKRRLVNVSSNTVLEGLYLSKVLELIEKDAEDPKIVACIHEFRAAFAQKEWHKALAIAEELCVLEDSLMHNIWFSEALAHTGTPEVASRHLIQYAKYQDNESALNALSVALILSFLARDFNLVMDSYKNLIKICVKEIDTLNDDEYYLVMLLPVLPKLPPTVHFGDLKTAIGETLFNYFNGKEHILSYYLIQVLLYSDKFDIALSKEKWVNFWTEILSEYPRFSLILRLMRTALLHFNGSDTALLNLPIEERLILQDLIDETELIRS